MMNICRILLFSFLVIYLSCGIALAADACRAEVVAGEEVLHPDDLSGSGIMEAVNGSLAYLDKIPGDRQFHFCDREYTADDLRETLVDFGRLWQNWGPTPEFYRRLAAGFEYLTAQDGTAKSAGILATGYFEPLVEGSLLRQGSFVYPLYRVPADLVSRDGIVGRLERGELVPYWTRKEIEAGNLPTGLELVYLDDPVAAFILQVQGSGKVRLRDGTIRPILFGAKNGRPYRSIGRFLVDRGEMRLEQVSLPAIVAYLEAHPEQRREILNYNESYVFFRWGEVGAPGPLGNLGVALTAGRSVALDQGVYPPGALILLRARKPLFNGRDEVIGWSPMDRLVLNQDSGSAIRGAGRVDLFLGAGARARNTAGLLKAPGQLYLLMAKK